MILKDVTNKLMLPHETVHINKVNKVLIIITINIIIIIIIIMIMIIINY